MPVTIEHWFAWVLLMLHNLKFSWQIIKWNSDTSVILRTYKLFSLESVNTAIVSESVRHISKVAPTTQATFPWVFHEKFDVDEVLLWKLIKLAEWQLHILRVWWPGAAPIQGNRQKKDDRWYRLRCNLGEMGLWLKDLFLNYRYYCLKIHESSLKWWFYSLINWTNN